MNCLTIKKGNILANNLYSTIYIINDLQKKNITYKFIAFTNDNLG